MRKQAAIGLAFIFMRSLLHASSGTSGAAFLDIPVGARPAAMGSAYTALATDAYAATWNPAGLGFLDSAQVAAQHLSYVQSTHVEYAAFGLPLKSPRGCTNEFWCGTSGVGGSIHYFGSGDITGLDVNGNPTGSFSTHSAAYNLSYGRAFGERLSLGATGKWIHVQLADVSANALAVDVGSFYRLRNNLRLAGTVTQMGGHLTFLSEGDPLPLAFHAACAYQPNPLAKFSAEWVLPRSGPTSVRVGGEWTPHSMVALRLGYRTDNLKGLSPVAGLSAGIGIKVWGQDLSYAWSPYGDLGDSHYFSLVMRFGEDLTEHKRNLITYRPSKKNSPEATPRHDQMPEYEQLRDLLSDPVAPARPAGDL